MLLGDAARRCATLTRLRFPANRAITSSNPAEGFGWLSESPESNIPPQVARLVGRRLHLNPDNPLGILKASIFEHFRRTYSAGGAPVFREFDDLDPVVTPQMNFESLLIPKDHVSVSKSDTYYIDANRLLRTHTSAHQTELLSRGHRAFLAVGDVYRRDCVDATHYPVFHQMEGVRVFDERELGSDPVAFLENDLKNTLSCLVKYLFGPSVPYRWVDTTFPFTDPSFEMEIFFQERWMEMFGSGIMRAGVLRNGGVAPTDQGWAFGLGLERFAMVLFGIPDIRLFWSTDERFLNQFRAGPGAMDTRFVPFSKFPACFKDISFWTNPTRPIHENDVHEIVRSEAGDLVENVSLIDSFVHPKTSRTSNCFRINYRSMERNLTNEEIDKLQFRIRDRFINDLKVELR
eukprot:gnl/Spiro4/6810_TR3524_c0_g1_i1.p1 gnl/Spiro4/6810_TR3524_c0_g1~~gnl/Spiro4/6810_TR3524_c0_g1_i1.p1  ORF type:complete len:404 (-),score=70.13 gnl/Spiro4/6810_TR3524_c0_g1_i1:41-1252(-)